MCYFISLHSKSERDLKKHILLFIQRNKSENIVLIIYYRQKNEFNETIDLMIFPIDEDKKD